MAVLKGCRDRCTLTWCRLNDQFARAAFCGCCQKRNPQPDVAGRAGGEKGIACAFHRLGVHTSTVVLNGDLESILIHVLDDAQIDVLSLGVNCVFDNVKYVQGQLAHL